LDIAVFPELCLSVSGYTLDRLDAVALTTDAPALAIVRAAAERNGTATVVGFPERAAGGVANSVACIDRDGSLAGVYRKTHLFGRERESFRPGDELLVVELAGRRVAPLVCFDVEFPEPARRLALAGADLLVTVSANMEPYYADHELATRARALENRLPHLYVNGVGSATGFELVGGSRSIASDGRVLAGAEDRREQLLLAPVGEVDRSDAAVDYLAHVRGGLRVVEGART
jgi:predicted amidohydrolase